MRDVRATACRRGGFPAADTGGNGMKNKSKLKRSVKRTTGRRMFQKNGFYAAKEITVRDIADALERKQTWNLRSGEAAGVP